MQSRELADSKITKNIHSRPDLAKLCRKNLNLINTIPFIHTTKLHSGQSQSRVSTKTISLNLKKKSTDQLELIRSLQFKGATLRGPDTWNAYGWASSFSFTFRTVSTIVVISSSATTFAITLQPSFNLFFFSHQEVLFWGLSIVWRLWNDTALDSCSLAQQSHRQRSSLFVHVHFWRYQPSKFAPV